MVRLSIARGGDWVGVGGVNAERGREGEGGLGLGLGLGLGGLHEHNFEIYVIRLGGNSNGEERRKGSQDLMRSFEHDYSFSDTFGSNQPRWRSYTRRYATAKLTLFLRLLPLHAFARLRHALTCIAVGWILGGRGVTRRETEEKGGGGWGWKKKKYVAFAYNGATSPITGKRRRRHSRLHRGSSQCQ